jgi:threonine/homoserine/homoserine lactone efflux protein
MRLKTSVMEVGPPTLMFGIHNYWLFILSGILLNIVPGQDTLYIVGRSISQGRRAGVLSTLGIGTGCLIHTLAAAFGLSAVLAAFSQAFMAIKFIGAAYLIYLGIRMLLSGASTHGPLVDTRPPVSGWVIFRQGILTNAMNPKVALFFLAFLPQFIDGHSGTKVAAFSILGLTFIISGTLWCMIVVWFASALSQRFRERPSTESWLKRAVGALFIGLGVKLVLERA